jgi:SPP1 gp7 family putative phage head morphogenesis protein
MAKSGWSKLDPSRTKTERQRFMREMTRRAKKLEKAVTEFLVTDDAFGMEEKKPISMLDLIPKNRTITASDIFQAMTQATENMAIEAEKVLSNKRQYAFLTSPQKVKQFQQWLQQQIDGGLLQVVGGIKNKPWTAEYVESAWRKGMMRAYTDVRKQDLSKTSQWYAGTKEQWLKSAFLQPEMMSKVELLATRAFEGMKGVTASMSTQMSRILADGLANGRGPRVVAKQMTDAIGKLNRTKYMVIARTELIHAHAEGQLDGYKLLGVEQVEAKLEWSTAKDPLVCPVCEAGFKDGPYTIEQARGLIPAHPNCRCAWAPYIEKKGRK